MTEANIQDIVQLRQKVNDGYTQAVIVKHFYYFYYFH